MTAADMMEKAAALTEQAFDQIRIDAVRDILGDLRDFLKTATPEERAGMRMAIDVIETNYSH